MKIRIIAALISLVLTPITVLLLVKVYFWLKYQLSQLTPQQVLWVNNGQIVLGVLVAVFGFWMWWRKRK